MGCKWIKGGDQQETKKMAIVIVRMLDEREEALKIVKEQIERQGLKTILTDVSIGTGAIVSSLKALKVSDI